MSEQMYMFKCVQSAYFARLIIRMKTVTLPQRTLPYPYISEMKGGNIVFESTAGLEGYIITEVS